MVSLRVLGVLAQNSKYGVVFRAVWTTNEGDRVVALKQVVLATGLHCRDWLFAVEGREPEYLQGGKEVPREKANRKFASVPMGSLFVGKAAMTRSHFDREISNHRRLEKLGLAPRLFSSWTDKSNDVHFGFMAMTLCHATVFDVLERRALTVREDRVISEVIRNLHEHNLLHGDLKPANVCVSFDKQGRIVQCLLIDCANVVPLTSACALNEEVWRYCHHVRKQNRERAALEAPVGQQ
jgi:serine/threonine protein kinase